MFAAGMAVHGGDKMWRPLRADSRTNRLHVILAFVGAVLFACQANTDGYDFSQSFGGTTGSAGSGTTDASDAGANACAQGSRVALEPVFRLRSQLSERCHSV